MKCRFCNKLANRTRVLISHERNCNANPDKYEILRKFQGNQYTKAAALGLPKPSIKAYIPSDEDKEQSRIRTTQFNSTYWTKEKRDLHSERMQIIVGNNPDSYSRSNVSGRTKLFDIVDGFGEITKVKGSWEYNVAMWLNSQSVIWTNHITPVPYIWNGRIHSYFPDFYLPDFDLYIEVKGYETDRDKCKWLAVDKELLIIRKEEYKNLDNVLNKYIEAG